MVCMYTYYIVHNNKYLKRTNCLIFGFLFLTCIAFVCSLSSLKQDFGLKLLYERFENSIWIMGLSASLQRPNSSDKLKNCKQRMG